MQGIMSECDTARGTKTRLSPELDLVKRRFFKESVREIVREALPNKDASMSRVKCKRHLAPQIWVDWFDLNEHCIKGLINQFMLDRTRVGEK